MSTNVQKLIKHAKNPKFIEEVFTFAQHHYQEKKRTTGETYLDHVVDVALILQNLGIDQTTIAASILHDAANKPVTENKKGVITEIAAKFGNDVARLVENTSNLNKIYYSFAISRKEEALLDEQKAEQLRKMFFAIAEDVRVVLIELAARIDGLNKITALPQELQKLYSTETLQIFIPIANRLGLGEIKRTLEDAAFANLYPKEFTWLQEHLKEKYEERQKYLKHFIPKIKKILKHERIGVETIDSRVKSSWSTWQKLQRKDMDIEKIYDLVALRIIVKDVAACYKTLGIIHKHFQPFSGKIQDYIAKPKENGYQSIHTTVFLEKETFSEIQIRTVKMHQEAQFGICAHWAYKERKYQAATTTLAWSKEVPEFLKTFNINFFQDRIFTFTPKGDVIELPKDATPVDFAYAVHSEIGNHCEGAKILGKIIPLSQALRNGDIVEIITSKKKLPSYDWLKFVKTGFARGHIKRLTGAIINPILSVPSYVKEKIFDTIKKGKSKTVAPPQGGAFQKPQHIFLAGQKDMAVTIAKCCSPRPGDAAKAYLTKYRAAVLHKASCMNFQKLARIFPEKVIEASWQQA